jgi:hypothetical protein
MAKNQLDNIDSDIEDQSRRESVSKSVGERPGNPRSFTEKKQKSGSKNYIFLIFNGRKA